MRRLVALLLSVTLLLTGCSVRSPANTEVPAPTESAKTLDDVIRIDPIVSTEMTYTGLNDPVLLGQIEDLVYTEALTALNSSDYMVENVRAIFISKEYIEEVMFNSQSNIYFGYTLDELNEIFQGTKYVFTLSDDGQTTVRELDAIEDNSTETIVKNVLIGSGVILICVTVSVVSAGAGAPAVSAIFAVGAGAAKTAAVSSAVFGGVTAGIVRGIETGDMDEALKAAAMGGSKGFKWGAISGAIVGGGSEAFLLKVATKSGLTMNEAALIQMDGKLPLDVISELHSLKEYQVYREADLVPRMVNGKTALVPNIDLTYVSELPDGTKVTNLVRMQRGLAPLDPATGTAYQLHHIGQKADGTLAVLTEAQHQGNSAILNIVGKASEINRPEFAETRKAFWQYLGNAFAQGVM